MAEAVGVEAEALHELARDFAAAPRAACYGRIGTCTQEFGALASWLVDVVNTLTGNLADIQLDTPTVLMMQIHVVNTSNTEPATATLHLTSTPAGSRETLTLDDRRVFATDDDQRRLRCLIDFADQGQVTNEPNGPLWSFELAPGTSHTIQLAVPSITLTEDAEIDPSQSMKDLGATSLDIVEVVSCSMRELKVKVPRSELNTLKNIDELVDLLLKVVQEKG